MNVNDLSININLSMRTMIGIFIALLAMVCATFLYVVWQWHSDWGLAHDKPEPISTITTPDTMNKIISSISGEHLFGQSLNKLGDMPITNLQLSVTGIVKVETEQSHSVSKAYISIAGQPSKIYQLGDHLPYGVRVYEITSDAVILENDGHLEKLLLPREHLKFKPKTKGRL
ncbi:MAG: hypothetical protein KIT56_05910 [Gammaproteobacteria bacterium]|nr:hypothetical protein [Gammaproteobacteria bacterium]MCW5583404.1 hypothetical protein [Gammaproteobacteria bacterium]